MADPPKSRGAASKSNPPPIPRSPVAPAAATTDVVAARIASEHAEGHSEITRNLEAPDAGELVARMLELVASEAEALLVGEDTKDRLGDLNVRTALASWDALHQPDEALRYLELAERHPLAPRLRIAAALAQPSAELLRAAESTTATLADSPFATMLDIELAEAWFFRFGNPSLAARCAERALARAHLDDVVRDHAANLATLAHAAAGAWTEVLRLRRAGADRETSAEAIASTAALMIDRGGDPTGALQLCWDALERGAEDGSSFLSRADTVPSAAYGGTGLLRLIDVALAAAARCADARMIDLLVRRAELLGTLSGGALEALATGHAIAGALLRDGQPAEATALWAQLADDPAASQPGAARRIATLASVWAAAACGDVAAELAARRRLVDSECTDVVTTHAWRALELAAAVGERPAALGDLAHAVTANTEHTSAEWWLDLLEHASPTAGIVARLEARGGLALRWAAALAERIDNTPRALELWRAACALDVRVGTEYDHVVRLLRSRDDDDLAEAYTLWALAERDGRTASALQCARGVVDLVRGDFVEAEETLLRAADLDPHDAFCRAALAAVYRAGKRYDQLAHILAELSMTLTSRDARAGAAREYAELLDGQLGDPTAARAALERMGTERPDDARAALALARTELSTQTPIARRLQLLLEQAQLLTALGEEPEIVVATYLEVLSIDPHHAVSLAGIESPARSLGLWDELARAFRGAPQTAENLETLAEALSNIAEWSELAEIRRKQLDAATSPDDKARRASQLARLYEQELGDADAAIRMLLLAHAELPDDAHGSELVRVLRAAERWSEMAQVLGRELENTLTAGSAMKQVTILLDLGELCTDKLDRSEDAVEAYQAILEIDPHHPIASERLEKLYVQLHREPELAQLLELRADATPDPEARAELHARIAALRAHRGDPAGSIAAYWAAFEADPSNRDVFTSLERECFQAERWTDAMRLYDAAIVLVENGGTRAYRLADLYARRGNIQLNFVGQIEDAIASYQKVIEIERNPEAAAKVLDEVCKTRGTWEPLIAAWERRAESQRDPQRRAEALRTAAMLAADRAKNIHRSMQLTRKLLKLDPKNSTAAALLEAYYEDQQDNTGLAEVLKLRLQHAAGAEERIELMKRLAHVSEDGARDVYTATDSYLKVLEAEPENRDALDALSRIYETTEQWTDLIEVTRRLIRVTTDRNTKSLLYFKCGSVMEAKFSRQQDALRYYDAALKTSPSCMPAVHGLRDLYRRRKEWPRVIETLEAELKLWADDKERAGVFAQIGGVYAGELGDPERAMTYYENALLVDPECLPANQALFHRLFEQGAWDKAMPIGNALAQRAAREGDPATRSDFYRKRGVVARMTGNARAAADSLLVALELRPLSTKVLDDLGLLAREQPDVWDFESTYRDLEKLYKKRDDADACLARVHVARAVILERDGDLDASAALYGEALALAPADLTILSALVDFHADMRRWQQAVDAIERFVGGAASPADRLAAMMRQVAIHADGEMNAREAIVVLRRVLSTAPTHQDAYYLLAQQYFLIRHYAEAKTAIERVIELATAPGMPLSAEALARYYYFKGRILDASGDARSAAPQYRRAIDYDPGYAPPALVLARRAADAGDQRQAETLLIDAAHAAIARAGSAGTRSASEGSAESIASAGSAGTRSASEGSAESIAKGGQRAAVPLQRGLARILLGSGDRSAAIEAYRGILNVEPDGASDRVALAEIYAIDDPQRAISELRKVLDGDIHHAPAYRLLASFYHGLGDTERATRVLTALDLLGFAEEADRVSMQRLRMSRRAATVIRALDDDSREQLLINAAPREPLGEVWNALAHEITKLVAQPSVGQNALPASEVDPRVARLATEVAAMFGVTPQVFIAERVPGLLAVTSFPNEHVVVDRALLAEADAPLRFMFGFAFEAIRGRYSALLHLGARQRRELVQILRGLLSDDPTGAAAELLHAADDDAAAMLERHAGTRDVDPGAWIDTMLACAKRGGLVACDDFAAAIWMVARLSGEVLETHDDAVALGAVLGGPDLVRFYLSDSYQRLRDLVTTRA